MERKVGRARKPNVDRVNRVDYMKCGDKMSGSVPEGTGRVIYDIDENLPICCIDFTDPNGAVISASDPSGDRDCQETLSPDNTTIGSPNAFGLDSCELISAKK